MISIIIPTYNEKENIGPLVAAIEKSVADEHEIIIIDDSSPDGTGLEVSRLMERHPCLRLAVRPKKLGLSGAIMEGLRGARGSIIVVMDADLSHPPDAIPGMLSSMEGSDLVIGSRLMQGGQVQNWPMHRRMISGGADMLARLVLGVRVSDPLSGFFAIRRKYLEKTRMRAKGYKLLLNILADNPRMRVSEVPYTFRDRHAGKTKLGIGEMATFLLDILRIRFH